MKALQQIRKRFLAEFDLSESGTITSWYGSFSKQEMLDAVEALCDPRQQQYFAYIDQDKPLLCFFENDDPIPLSLSYPPPHYSDPQFRVWVGRWFAPQFDRLVAGAWNENDWVKLTALARCPVLTTAEQLAANASKTQALFSEEQSKIIKLMKESSSLSAFRKRTGELLDAKKLRCLSALPGVMGWVKEKHAASCSDLLALYAANKGSYCFIRRVAQVLLQISGRHHAVLNEILSSSGMKRAKTRMLVARFTGWTFPLFLFLFAVLILSQRPWEGENSVSRFSLEPFFQFGYLFLLIVFQCINIARLRKQAFPTFLLLFIPYLGALFFWLGVVREQEDPMNRWIVVSLFAGFACLIFAGTL